MSAFTPQEQRAFGLQGFEDAMARQPPQLKRSCYRHGYALGDLTLRLDVLAHINAQAMGLHKPDPASVPTRKKA